MHKYIKRTVLLAVIGLTLSACLGTTVATRPVPEHQETADTKRGERPIVQDFAAWVIGNMVIPR